VPQPASGGNFFKALRIPSAPTTSAGQYFLAGGRWQWRLLAGILAGRGRRSCCKHMRIMLQKSGCHSTSQPSVIDCRAPWREFFDRFRSQSLKTKNGLRFESKSQEVFGFALAFEEFYSLDQEPFYGLLLHHRPSGQGAKMLRPYAGKAERHPLDERFPDWGDGFYFLNPLISELSEQIQEFVDTVHLESAICDQFGLGQVGRNGFDSRWRYHSFIDLQEFRSHFAHTMSLCFSSLGRINTGF
jgi:hypothetical protein